MTTHTSNTKASISPLQRQAAIVSGISLILMAIAAGIAYGYVFQQIVVPENLQTTWNNIHQQKGLFSLGILGWLIVLVTDLLVAWGFYHYFKPTNDPLSQLTALFRLTYVLFLGVAISNLLSIQTMVAGSSTPEGGLNHLQQLSVQISTFEATWSLGLIIFGIHLILVGTLAFQSVQVPKILSILLWIAGFGYVLIHSVSTFIPDQTAILSLLNTILILPMTLGELGFGIWLLLRPRPSK